MKKHPLARALRVDKMTLAGLEATLRLYLDSEKALEEIPTLSMIIASDTELLEKATALAARLKAATADYQIKVENDISMVGGGALPIEQLPTHVVSVSSKKSSTAELESQLRESTPPIIVRVKEDRVLLDVRTIVPEEFDDLTRALVEIGHKQGTESKK